MNIYTTKTMIRQSVRAATLAGGFLFTMAQISAASTTVRITIESSAPAEGTLLTPFWLGIQDGSFDLFNAGEAASEAIERMAEDGNLSVLRADFEASGAGTLDGVLTGLGMEGTPPLFFPGQVNSWTISLDGTDPRSRYLSYAAMILPSNDAFVAPADPMMYPLFDTEGALIEREIVIPGSAVYDAGTEVNDEIAANVPVLGQAEPDTGSVEGGVIAMHPGFLPEGAVLAAFPGADFTATGYEVARIRVEQVPVDTVTVEFTVESLAPTDGTVLTPVWMGIHDGSFDLFDNGAAASSAVERFAEDGSFAQLQSDFAIYALGGLDGVVTGLGMEGTPPLFFPGQVNTWTVNLDRNSPAHRYLSYGAMILPSNDAFIANEDSMAVALFDAEGNFIEQTLTINGNQVWDAGTEVNDEVAANVPLLGQAAPDTGASENGVVAPHPGFMSDGTVLSAFPAADFLAPDYAVLRVTLRRVNNPFSAYPVDALGARQTSTFGTIFDAAYPFVYQADHGWLYLLESGEGSGFWAYNFRSNLGWIYIHLDTYPVVYHESLGWLYFLEGSDPRQFYVFASGIWTTVD
jgi:hypothetical protein